MIYFTSVGGSIESEVKMKSYGPLNKEQIEFITEKFEEADIAHEYIEMEMNEEKTIFLSGEIYSENELKKLKEILMEHTEAEDIEDDDLLVIESVGYMDPNGPEEDDDYVSDELSPLKEEFAGTEDVYQSLEDGIPYIPPMEDPEENYHFSKSSWLKKRRKN